jgi:hypothetical protein
MIMTALKKTKHVGKIVWLGSVPNREDGLMSGARQSLWLSFAGAEGEAHSGVTRPACARVSGLYPAGTEIRNVRQLSVVSVEELREIAAHMGLSALDPALLGVSMVIEGIADFSHLPPSSRLQGARGATLVVDMINLPCNWPGQPIEARHPGKGKAFKSAAKGRRGVTAWVEREGDLHLGDALTLYVPDQPAWTGLVQADKTAR